MNFWAPSWVSLGAVLVLSWAVLGASWAVSESSWTVLGPSWGPLGQFWGDLGSLLGHCGASGSGKSEKAKNIEKHTGKSTIVASRGSLGRPLGGLWGRLGRVLGSLGPRLGVLGRSLGVSGPSLAVVGAFFSRRTRRTDTEHSAGAPQRLGEAEIRLGGGAPCAAFPGSPAL